MSVLLFATIIFQDEIFNTLLSFDTQVVEHLSKQMTRFPNEVKLGLKLSACLGSQFDANMLRKGSPQQGFDVAEFLQFAVEVGIV